MLKLCKNCNKYFFDENATKETTLAQTVIPATGHNWGEPMWSRTEDGKTASATCTCQNDNSHQTSETATVTSGVKTEATCTEKGVTTYSAFAKLNGKTYTATKDVADIPVTSHSYKNDKCTACSAIDPDYISSEPDNGNSDSSAADNNNQSPQTGNSNNHSPQTGDNSNIALSLSIMLAACTSLTGVVFYDHKKKYNS